MKRGIIITSFGTSHEDARKLYINPIVDRIREEFQADLVLKAFTSRMIISILKKRDDYYIYNLSQALEKMKEEGIKDILILPLLIIPGKEYDKIKKEVHDFLDLNRDFNIRIAKTLLSNIHDYERVVDALDLESYRKDEALVLMAHGTSHGADHAYEKIDEIIRDRSYENVFMASLDGEKSLDDLLEKLKQKGIDQVSLKPFMLLAGNHVKVDMSSDNKNSWKSRLEENGIGVSLDIEALGGNKGIQDIFIEHLNQILDRK